MKHTARLLAVLVATPVVLAVAIAIASVGCGGCGYSLQKEKRSLSCWTESGQPMFALVATDVFVWEHKVTWTTTEGQEFEIALGSATCVVGPDAALVQSNQRTRPSLAPTPPVVDAGVAQDAGAEPKADGGVK